MVRLFAISVPSSSGVLLQPTASLRKSSRRKSFSPLLIGGAAVTQGAPGEARVHQSFSVPSSSGCCCNQSFMSRCVSGLTFQSPLHWECSCNSDGSFNYRCRSALSVPSSLGVFLQLADSQVHPLGYLAFSPLFIASAPATCSYGLMQVMYPAFSPLFIGSVPATAPKPVIKRFPRPFIPLFIGGAAVTSRITSGSLLLESLSVPSSSGVLLEPYERQSLGLDSCLSVPSSSGVLL